MATRDRVSDIGEAIAVLHGTEDRVSAQMRSAFSEIVVALDDARQASLDWMLGSAPHDEPQRVRVAHDEIKLALEFQHLLDGTDAEHQFYVRALKAALALTTIRYAMLVEAGRLGDGKTSDTEQRMMRDSFRAGRDGYVTPYQTGAALQEAREIGLAGGSWVRFVLDGVGA